MKNYPMFLTALVLMLSILSCSESDPVEEGVRKEVKVTATFKGLSSSVTSRASDNAWEEGDAIGLFMKGANTNLTTDALSHNVKFTTTGSTAFANSSDSKVYFPFDKSNVDFISYYPYKDNLNGLTYPVEVSDQSSLRAIDLMYSNNVNNVNYVGENIQLVFEHQLTKVVLNINQNNSDGNLDGLKATISNVSKDGSFSLVDGTLISTGQLGDISFNVNDTYTTAEAILLPDSTLEGKKLTVTLGQVSYSYLLSNSSIIKSFDKSTKCVYNITIDPNEQRILDKNVTAQITEWITVTDDITVEEIPYEGSGSESNPDEDPKDAEGEGEPSTDPDGGGKGEDGDPSPEPVVGDGTQENPYSIAQVKQLESGNGIWLEGYIVGGYTSSYFSNDNFTTICSSTSITNVALADSQSETSPANTYPIDFSTDPSSTNFSKKINLKDNSGNMKKKLLLLGNINIKEVSKWARIINVKQVFLEGVEIK